MTIIDVYHGTNKKTAEKILKEGFILHSPEKVRDEILEKHGLSLDDVPKWTWKEEVSYRWMPYISVTTDIKSAKGYSRRPFEMRNVMEGNILRATGKIKRGTDRAMRYETLEEDIESVVLCCKLDTPEKHLRSFELDLIEKKKVRLEDIGEIRVKNPKDLICSHFIEV